MNTPLTPPIPFVWPEPLVSAGVTQYASALPFEAVARAALSVFGVVSAIDAQAVDWMEGYLSDNPKAQLRLVISIHPTCRTTEADLQNLLRLVERVWHRWPNGHFGGADRKHGVCAGFAVTSQFGHGSHSRHL